MHDLACLIEPDHPQLSVTRQAELLGLARRTVYYRPVNNPEAQTLLKRDMDTIDAIYTDLSFYGYRRMRLELMDRYGIPLGRKRIRTVMGLLGLETQYPKPNTSKPGSGANHMVYPYLLRNVTAQYPNHIWGVDITYVKTQDGFVYLVAFIDWYSRYVVAWSLAIRCRMALCYVRSRMHCALSMTAGYPTLTSATVIRAAILRVPPT